MRSVGGAVAGVIGVGLFPAEPLALMRKAEREVLRSLAGALGRIGDLMHGGVRPEADWTLAAAQDIHSQLAALAAARMTARANVRIAPRRWRLRGAVALEDARIGRLDLLANAVLSLFRVSADALDEGDALAAALSSSVIALAEVPGDARASAAAVAARRLLAGRRQGQLDDRRGRITQCLPRSADRLDHPRDRTRRRAALAGALMPGVGLEPTSSCERRLLRPLPLPIWAPGPGVGSYCARSDSQRARRRRSARTLRERWSAWRLGRCARGVVELVDTPALGAGGRKPLGVQVPPPAVRPGG
jgi:hypothetical protein